MTDEEALRVDVELPAGPMSVSALWGGGDGRGTVVIAHGAGAGMEHPFLTGFTAALRDAGLTTLRFSFPYIEQGRRMPGPPAHAIETWRSVVLAARSRQPDAPVWAAGKSYGGRMASMAVAAGMDVEGLIYLGYPLHAPGKPERPRADHLPAITVPQLFVEGTKDPFILPLAQFDEVLASCVDAAVHWVDGGGHSFEVAGRKRAAGEIGASLAAPVVDFVTR